MENKINIQKSIRSIFYIWLTLLVSLAMLQLLHFPFGFAVWPMGEDRNWIGFIMTTPGIKMVHAYWSMNDRNPLSAWWWLAISPLIKSSDYSLYFIRKCVDPFIAIVTFLLLDQICKHKARLFTFSTAMIVLMWNFSSYFEQIIWEFIVALGFNLLAIYFYCKHIDNNRAQSSDFILALLCYFIAIATYTLQSGALIAVFFLSLFRNEYHHNVPVLFKNKLWLCFRDTSFFAAIFIIYNLIWYTVSRNASAFYIFNWSVFFNQFTISVKDFIFHPIYLSLWQLIQNDWSTLTIIFTVLTTFVSCYWMFKKTTNEEDALFATSSMFWVFIILFAIAAPTIIVESTSQIWPPGTRSLMVQQVWQPLLYVLIIFLITDWLPIPKKMKLSIILLSLSSLIALTNLFALNYNYRLVLRTHYQRVLAKGIKKLHVRAPAPVYLVKLTEPNNADLNTIPVVIASYGSTMLHRLNSSLRLLQTAPNAAFDPFWKVEFGENTQGVKNAGPIESPSITAYSNLWIVFFDGKKVWLPKKLDKKDFDGFQVDWKRNQPIYQ